MRFPEALPEAILVSARRHAPKLSVARIVVEPKVDSLGDDSLRVVLILRKRPADPVLFREQLLRVIDETRGMLAAEGDLRFPYFEVTSEKDEKEKERELERLREG